MSVGRNDTCPCGSGKKYKRCCLLAGEVVSLQRFREERKCGPLLDRLASYIDELKLEHEKGPALIRFFGGPPPEDPTEEDLALPMDWVIFGHGSPSLGMTLCEHFAVHAHGVTSEERTLAAGWANAQPGFFHVTSVGARELHLRRLWDVRTYVVTDNGANLKTGDLVAAWLLPVPSGFRFGCSVYPFPVESTRPLEHLLREELFILRRQRPDASWDDLYRACWPRLVDDAMLAAACGDALLGVRFPNGPSVQGAPSSHVKWTAVADRLTREMRQGDADPEKLEGALRLWWDAVYALQPRVTRAETWVGGLLYVLSNRIYGSDMTQGEAAVRLGTSAGMVGARAREIETALKVEPNDPRYVDLLDPLIRMDWRLDCMTLARNGPRDLAPLSEGAPREAASFLREEANREDGPVVRAEELVDEAWETSGKQRIRLAKQAVNLWPDAADAYVILGNEALTRGDLQDARRFYIEGMQAAGRTLGSNFLTENIGHFWGHIETRPYMRARAGFAECLWLLGERETAISHYEELLRLNPGDNQGIRYVLARRLLEMGDDDRLGRLLAEHADDGMADMVYTRALWHFRQTGQGREADAFLQEAVRQNPHVPAYLLGERSLPPEPPEYIGWGDETEAAAYAQDFGDRWRVSPGALTWLANRTGR